MPGTTSNGIPAAIQGLGFFAAATENKRIAALESNDIFALPGVLDQQRFDLTLVSAMFSRLLTDIDQLRFSGSKLQQLMVRQLIEENHLRRFEAALAFKREQFRITWTRANQKYLAETVSSHDQLSSKGKSITLRSRTAQAFSSGWRDAGSRALIVRLFAALKKP